MKTVLLRAPVLTQSGYGQHSRQVAKWLLKKHEEKKIILSIQAMPWGNTPWILDAQLQDGLIGSIMSLTTAPTTQYDYSFQVQLPNEWDCNLAHQNIGITAAVETDICNPEWTSACHQVKKVIVPSNHVKDVLLKTDPTLKNVFVIPESFPDTYENVHEIPLALPEITTKFNFLVVGQITGNRAESDRKNLFFTVKWFCEAFRNDPDVGLIIKTNSGRGTKIDRSLTTRLFEQILREVRPGVLPRVYLVHGDMSDEEMNKLYVHPTVKALVTATRGEGFGLPILEAAAVALPVIATNWSGHLDFMNKGKFIKLNYDLQSVHDCRIDGKIFVKGAKWAEVHEKDFKLKLTKFRNSSSVPKEWAVELSKIIRAEYSFEAISKQYDTMFPEI